MVLKVRLSPEVWEAASEAVPNFNETLQRQMNSCVCWLFRQRDPVYDTGDRMWKFQGEYQMLATDRFKYYLEKPTEVGAQWNYDIVFFQRMKKHDRAAAIAGKEINDEIAVLVPGQGLEEPTKIVPTGSMAEVAFVVKSSKYRPLASYLKAPINMAWSKIKVGRQIKRIFWEDALVFYLTVDPNATIVSTAKDAANLNDALEEVGVGRVMDDPYELKKVREMAAKYGDTPNEAPPKTV